MPDIVVASLTPPAPDAVRIAPAGAPVQSVPAAGFAASLARLLNVAAPGAAMTQGEALDDAAPSDPISNQTTPEPAAPVRPAMVPLVGPHPAAVPPPAIPVGAAAPVSELANAAVLAERPADRLPDQPGPRPATRRSTGDRDNGDACGNEPGASTMIGSAWPMPTDGAMPASGPASPMPAVDPGGSPKPAHDARPSAAIDRAGLFGEPGANGMSATGRAGPPAETGRQPADGTGDPPAGAVVAPTANAASRNPPTEVLATNLPPASDGDRQAPAFDEPAPSPDPIPSADPARAHPTERTTTLALPPDGSTAPPGDLAPAPSRDDVSALPSDAAPALPRDATSALPRDNLPASTQGEAAAYTRADIPAPRRDIPAQASDVLTVLSRRGAGTHSLELELHPADLGRIAVVITRPATGPATVSLTADRPETLLRLVRDRAALARALDKAGLPAEGRTLSFHLATDPSRQQDPGATTSTNPGAPPGMPQQQPFSGGMPGDRPPRDGTFRGRLPLAGADQAEPDPAAPSAHPPLHPARRRGVDITA